MIFSFRKLLNPVDISGTVVGESPDCLLLSGTVVGENLDHVCWEAINGVATFPTFDAFFLLFGQKWKICPTFQIKKNPPHLLRRV